MTKRNLGHLSFMLAGCTLAWLLYLSVAGELGRTGVPMVLFFVLTGLGFQGFDNLRGYTFSTLIFAGVALSLYFPEYFIAIGRFKLAALIIPLIQVIMFGMGTAMSPSDFMAVFRAPKGVLIGLSAQLTLMPLLGYFLASFSGLPAEIAAGIVLVGCSPSGVASNVMAYLARANLALSITITSVATLLSPFITPLAMRLLAGEFVQIDVVQMMWDIVKMILLPIGMGLLVNRLLGRHTARITRIMPLLSMLAIGLIITIITAAGRDSLLQMGGVLILLVLVHNFSGYLLGYAYARLLRMDRRDARTIALEVGMQNSGLASGIAYSLGKIATMGLAPAVFGPLMNISGSALASYWHNRDPEKAASA
ncbi:bile acid:sodium symporter family protein [Robiginitalea sediminis]|uniref:bile acid:sodium symporter family protein n=1 Tax=Robiginitalea sediminis TaxID=1982593 RepID=UPI001E4C1023|nr:bile acid:sodium symporter family protein [Robiginitalea sediminis]